MPGGKSGLFDGTAGAKGYRPTNADRIRVMKRDEILQAAQKCVSGDREQDYGSPENSFKTIAELWEPYLRAKCVSDGANVCIKPEDVAALMVLFKMARVATGHGKADNWVDACGYAANGGEIEGMRSGGSALKNEAGSHSDSN